MSCIRLRANSRLAILFEDFLEICDGDMLAALLLAILVYWTDIKLAKKDTNLWIWKSHEDFQEDLMVDKPGMKPPHRTTISSKLDFLQAKDFIEWRKNPKLALDRTRHYLVHLPEVQAAIDRLPPIVSRKTDIRLLENRHSIEEASEAPSDELPNVGKPTYAESRKTDNALSEKQHSNVGKPTSNTNDYITEITPSEITEEGTYGATAPTPAHLIRNEFGELIEVPADLAEKALASQRKVLDLPEPNLPDLKEVVDEAIEEVEEEQRRRTPGELPAVRTNDNRSHSHSAIGNDDPESEDFDPDAHEREVINAFLGIEEEDTAKRQAVTIGVSTHGNDINDPHAYPGNSMDSHYRLYPAEVHERGVSHAAQLQATPDLSRGADRPIDTSQQAPGTRSQPEAVATSPLRYGDGGKASVQAQSAPVSASAQAIPPVAGSVVASAPTAQTAGLIPKRPRHTKPPDPLTLMGSQVMGWIGEIRGAKPRMTAGNVKACNALSECDGISKETLAAYFELMEAQHKDVDLLTAAGETGNDKVGFLSFESNLRQLKRKLAQGPPQEDKYTAASKSKERNERWMERQRALIIANGGELPK